MDREEAHEAYFRMVWLEDEAFHRGTPSTEGEHEEIDEARSLIARFICKIYGHEPTQDQCGMPEHDYCTICEELTPGQAPRRADGVPK